MKRSVWLICLVWLSLQTALAKNPTKIIMTGCGMTKLIMIDRETNKVEWSHELRKTDDCNDIEITKQNNILFAYKHGARMIDWDENLLWDYKVNNKEELYTATQLSNGNYLLAICGEKDRIVELNKKGEQIDQFTFDLGIKSIHGHFRQILLTKKGTFLIPVMAKGELIEINRKGEILRTVHVGGNPFSVKKSGKNCYMVSCGDAHCWVVVDWAKGEVIERSPSNIGDVELLFVSEIVPFKDGRKLISNWNGHAKGSNQPALLEVDKENNLLWKLPSELGIEKVSALYCW